MSRRIQQRRDPPAVCGVGRASGFTLVELLVVVAIIGLLMALTMPAIGQSRESARRLKCQNNLKQLATAVANHAAAHGRFPAGLSQKRFADSPVYRGTSLFVHLLPSLEQGELRERWKLDDPLRMALGGASAPAATVIGGLVCPSSALLENPVRLGDRTHALTSYGGNAGARTLPTDQATADGVFFSTGPASEPRPGQQPVRPADLTDGASRTILLGERSHADANYDTFAAAGWADALASWSWWAPSGGRKSIARVTLAAAAPLNYRLDFSYATRDATQPSAASSAAFATYADLRLSAHGSEHAGGANVAWADGAVRFLGDSIAVDLLRALSTRAGGELPSQLTP